MAMHLQVCNQRARDQEFRPSPRPLPSRDCLIVINHPTGVDLQSQIGPSNTLARGRLGSGMRDMLAGEFAKRLTI
jgi:hypothetical protein